MKLCSDSQCDRKGEELPLSEFPINRKNSSGRHSYCRKCSTRRANETRLKNKPRQDAVNARRRERERQARIAAQNELPVADQVYQEIAKGNRTREGIEAATGLHEDAISDALASLYDADLVRPVGPRFYKRAKAA